MRLTRRHRRRRRVLASRWAKILPWLGFRYDYERSSSTHDAYLLRGVGERLGPVFLVDRAPEAVGEDAAPSAS